MKIRVVEEIDSKENIPKSPETPKANGLADLLITAVNDEWKTIQEYNTIIMMMRELGQDRMIPVIEDINNEENKHVGQIQTLLSLLSENTGSIAEGEKEAATMLGSEDLLNPDFSGSENIFDKRDIDTTKVVKLSDKVIFPSDRDGISIEEADDDFTW